MNRTIKPRNFRKITNPEVKKQLLNAVIKELKQHQASKKDIKVLFYNLYDMYPQGKDGSAWIYDVLPKEDVKALIERGMLVSTKDGTKMGLGPNGLSLISMWNTERLTRWVILLTIITTILTIIGLLVLY